MRRNLLVAAGVIAGGLLTSQASAVVVELDYTHDTFFGSNATAKAALERAALDVSNAITTSLGATTDTSSGTSGSTTATFDLDYSYTNPTTGTLVPLPSTAVAANQVRIFVGARNLDAPTLGQGGPATSASINLGGSGFPDQWPGAVANASTNANANFGRGGGPVIYSFSGSDDWDGNVANYSINVGSAVSNLWFDNDANWHFDHTTPVESGKSDLYSVALHEILHALGVGTSRSWNDLATGNDWSGANVIALLGTGTDVLQSTGGDGPHIAPGTMSRNIYTLAPQEAAMDPDITSGTRKYLTELDLAFLQDINWQTVAVPEPTSAVLSGGALALLLRRRRSA